MYSQIAANKRKTILVFLVFFAFVAAIAWIFNLYIGGNPSLFYGVLVGSLIYAVITYFAGSRLALARRPETWS